MKQRVGSGLFVGMVLAVAVGCGGSEAGTPDEGNPTAGKSSPSTPAAGSQASAGAKASAGSTAPASAGKGGTTGTSTSPVTSAAGSNATGGAGATAAGATASAGSGGASASAGTSGSAAGKSGSSGGGSATTAGSGAAGGGAAAGGCGSESFAAIYDSIFKNTDHNCTGALCHGRDAANAMPVGNLSLSSASVAYMQLVKASSTSMACSGKTRVIPGDATGSLLVQKLRGANVMCGGVMPVGAEEIPDAELKRITDWITSGACDN
jgi:hypothetical protein